MTAIGCVQILVYFGLIVAVTKPLGALIFHILERPLVGTLGRIERGCLRAIGVRQPEEQTWKEYSLALLAFSALGMLVTYTIQRAQHALPLNPQGLNGVEPFSSFNTAASFTTNTNWQGYSGETTMSYFTQMAGLAWHNFISAGAGIAIAIALARGLTRAPSARGTIGNFWVDLFRSTFFILLPLSTLLALVLVAGGVIQNFSPYLDVTTLEGAKQTLAMGPAASQIAIKQLGTNGGGFFNANSAHPFECTTPLINFIQCFSILGIAAALTYTYGRMAKDTRQGWALFTAMSVLFFAGCFVCYWAEAQGNPIVQAAGAREFIGNMEGKETRFGVAASTLWAVATTAASNGSVNSMHDSYTPLGGLVPLLNIQLGEVIFGGVGAGLYGMLMMVVLTVFLAGLMVGRTPEYLGKKIEPREMKLLTLYILVFPIFILVFTAASAAAPFGLSSLNNAGPHGLTEMLYAFSSATGNNGSAFAGLNANTPWYNTTIGLAILFGRFFMIIPALAVAGSMAKKKVVPVGLGTFPTNGLLFVALLVAVILVVGALTFFPVLSLGPLVEHFLATRGKAF